MAKEGFLTRSYVCELDLGAILRCLQLYYQGDIVGGSVSWLPCNLTRRSCSLYRVTHLESP